eukprot:TRINITY_DN5371_c0_g1_i1.p1 TRINITY_DN5371_c0_g1~~TRINITY_DN5371_c0_g1_i1.p1  ORF type:complete len:1083 (-),score=299.78 TRINITY_DN5371_c0_g1_i1:22-2994(-)
MKEWEVIDKESIILQKQKLNAKKKITEAGKNKEKMEEKLSNYTESMENFVSESEKLKTDYEEIKGEQNDLQKQMKVMKKTLNDIEENDIRYRQEIKHLGSERRKLERSLEKKESNRSSKKKLIKEDKERLESLNRGLADDIQQHKNLTEQLDDMYNQLRDESAPIHKELEKLQTELIPYEKNINDAKALLDLAKNEAFLFTSKSEKEKEKVRVAKKKLENLKETISQRKMSIKKNMKKKEKLITRKGELQEELDDLIGLDTQIMEEISKLRSKSDELYDIIKKINNESKVLSRLMYLKQQGEIPGMLGKLGNLGTIEELEKYDVAITTACGNKLNNIVVDNSHTATKCIEILKNEKLGRSTFIILEKLQRFKKYVNGPIDYIPEESKRLFDLIQVTDERVKLAFYFSLRDTLVCDDIDIASRISTGESKRWRVVSLNGIMYEKSGAISGGGREKRGGMSSTIIDSTVNPEEMRKEARSYMQEATQKSKELEELRRKFTYNEREIENIENKIIAIEESIPRLEIDINSLSKQSEELENIIPNLNDNGMTEEDEQKMQELEQEVKERVPLVAKAELEAENIKDKIKSLELELTELGGSKIKNMKELIELLSENIEQNNEAITKIEISLKTAKKSVNRSSESITKITAELEDIEHQFKEKNTQLKDIHKQGEKILEEGEQLSELYKEKTALVKKSRSKYKRMQKDMNKLRSVEVDLRNKLEDSVKVYTDQTSFLSNLHGKLEALQKKKEELRFDEEQNALLPELSPKEMRKISVDVLKKEISHLKRDLTKMAPNMSAIKEFRDKLEEKIERSRELEDVTMERDSKNKEYEEFQKKRFDEFMEGFNQIRSKLSEMYKMITLDDGDADLEPNDSLDPFSEGISFRVRPPKKTWRFIHNLSGGEKTLSSLALVFALHSYKPTPIYIMDEIDAALDFKNVSIVANYIKERTKDAQFLIISLRNFMFELADRLVGIYKTQNCTKTVTIDPCAFSIPKA